MEFTLSHCPPNVARRRYICQRAPFVRRSLAFFQNLAAHGMNQSNSLFAVRVDEGDHFAGGASTPPPDVTLAYSHTTCVNLSACPVNQIGEVNANLGALLPSSTPACDGQPLNEQQAKRLIVRAQALLTQAHALSNS